MKYINVKLDEEIGRELSEAYSIDGLKTNTLILAAINAYIKASKKGNGAKFIRRLRALK